jgi:hypothetical protein
MPSKLRPTGLGSGIDKNWPDYTVVTGESEVGRIYQTRGGPDSLRLVLVANHQLPDDALGSRRDPRGGQGAVSEELGCLEGVGQAGRGGLKKEAPEYGRQIRRLTTPLWEARSMVPDRSRTTSFHHLISGMLKR